MAIPKKTFSVSADDLHLFIRGVLGLLKDHQSDHYEYLVKSFYRYSDRFEDEYAEFLMNMNTNGFVRKTYKKNKKENFESLQAWKDLYYICSNTADDIKELRHAEILDALHFKELGFAADKESLFSKDSYEKRLELLAFFEERADGFIDLFNEINTQSSDALKKIKEEANSDNEKKYPDLLWDLMFDGLLSSIAHIIENPQAHKHELRSNVKKIFKTINFHAVFCLYSDYYFSIAQKQGYIILSEFDQKRFNHFFSTVWCNVILDAEFDIDGFIISDMNNYLKKYLEINEEKYLSFYKFFNEAILPEENVDTSNRKYFEVKNHKDIRYLFDMLKVMNIYSKDISSFQGLIIKRLSNNIDMAISHSETELVTCKKFVISLFKKYKFRHEKQLKDKELATNLLTFILSQTLENKRNINTDSTLRGFAYTHFLIISDAEFKTEKSIPKTDSQLENAISIFAKNIKAAQVKEVKKAA